MRRLPVPLFTALALALLLAGCGSSDSAVARGGHDHAENSPVVGGARELEVAGKDLRFTPAQLEVTAGEDVTIVLTAVDVAHDFTIEDADVHVGAAAGETASGGLRIDEPGTYTFVCSVPGHAAAGMTGTLTVTEA